MEISAVCNRRLHLKQPDPMTIEARTDEQAVQEAREWSEFLVSRSYQGPSDSIDEAMARVEATWGIPVGALWGLRYRPPKTIAVGIWSRLGAVYQYVRQRQEANLRHDLEITKKLPPTRARLALIREIEARLGPADGVADAQAASPLTGVTD
jgi:hypothetical protein